MARDLLLGISTKASGGATWFPMFFFSRFNSDKLVTHWFVQFPIDCYPPNDW